MVLGSLQGGSFREVHVVDSIHNRLCSQDVAAEETPVQTFERIVASLQLLELDVDGAFAAFAGDAAVDHLSVLFRAFDLKVFLEFLLPIWLGLAA